MDVLSKRLDVSVEKIAFILQQREEQIRKNPSAAIIALNKELTLLASEYGTRGAIPEHVMEEATRFVSEKFGQLGVKEVRAAYRAWASNELEIDNAEIYGGIFNVRQLGKVLEAWVIFRNRVLAEYEKQKSQTEFEAAEKKKAEKRKAEFEASLPLEIEALKKVATSWQDVPGYFYGAIQKRWPIVFEPGEAGNIISEAAAIADIEIEKAKTEGLTSLPARLMAMDMEKAKTERAKTIAQKIAVFMKVVKNENFTIPTK